MDLAILITWAWAGVHNRVKANCCWAMPIGHGDVIVLICGGPKGAGMQEIYQVTSAVKALPLASTSRC
jgi:dihydroxyacid dehydratase/phosphogluconate dehydratase